MVSVTPSTMASKRVAVIGAGPAGLTSAKAMVEAGLVPVVVFDKAKGVAGMWNADLHPAWASLHTNVSRHTMSFTDFPWTRVLPSPVPDYPTQRQMQQYLTAYSKQHLKPQHFSMQSTVTSVEPAGDGQRWRVTWRSESGSEMQEVFEHVVVASGFFNTHSLPSVQGLDTFPGTAIHSGQYRKPTDYAGQRVVVVGAAFSACEIASELAHHAARVDHVVTKSFWVVPRYLPVNPDSPAPTFLPLDVWLLRRSTRQGPHETCPPNPASYPVLNKLVEGMVGDQAKLLSPALAVDPTQPLFVGISEHYAGNVRAGRIRVHKGRVTHVQGPSVTLDTGEILEDADVIIFGTGFRPSLPYLSPSILDTLSFQPDNLLQPLILHKAVFHPDLPNMAFVGMYRGPQQPVMEMQAKWAAGIFSGKLPAIPESVMREGLQKELDVRNMVPRPQFPHGDAVGYYDDLAEAAGLQPPTPKPLRNSPTDFFLASYYGPKEVFDEVVQDLQGRLQRFEDGFMVAGAVFRSLEGEWSFERTIDSRLDTSPSGVVQGTATFTPLLSPSDPAPYPTQLLYHEQGEFKVRGGPTFKATRQYVWEYDAQSDQLSVHFSKNNAKDYEFHKVRVLPRRNGRNGSETDEGGWRAVGEQHLCGRDLYDTQYQFVFQGVHVVAMEVRYDVKGPNKDYTSVARYTRQITSAGCQ